MPPSLTEFDEVDLLIKIRFIHRPGDTFSPFEAIIYGAIGTGSRKRGNRAAILLPTPPYRLSLFPASICGPCSSRNNKSATSLHVVFSIVLAFFRVYTRYKVYTIVYWLSAKHNSQLPSGKHGEVVETHIALAVLVVLAGDM